MTRSVVADRPADPSADRVDLEAVRVILERHRSDRGGLIAILTEVQAACGYLSEPALRLIAEETGRPLVDVYGVATFYKSFSLKPRGKHLVCACLGTACHVRGSERTADELGRQLRIAAGETTPDGEFTLETVNCLGACALGPVVVIDGRYFPKVRSSDVQRLLDQARAGFDAKETGGDKWFFPLGVSCPRCNHNLMDPAVLLDGHPAIRVTASTGRRHGWLRLSCLYGSASAACDLDAPEGEILALYCPHCHAALGSGATCPECSAPMVPMFIRDGGVLQVCSRLGCKGRALDLV